jgi:hypothetical protein
MRLIKLIGVFNPLLQKSDIYGAIMETVLYSNELFVITRVEVYDEDKDSVASFFELIELPNKKIGMFDSYSDAEKAMITKLSGLDEN